MPRTGRGLTMRMRPLELAPTPSTSKPSKAEIVPGVWSTSSPCLNLGFRKNPPMLYKSTTFRPSGGPHFYILVRGRHHPSTQGLNRAFFVLTHESMIWKRFLNCLQRPVPYFNDKRFSFGPRDFEPERLLAQTSSADDNWRCDFTRAFHANTMFLDAIVYDMKLLPGGKYLVVAAKGASATHVIAVFELYGDRPDHMVFKLISSTNLHHRAFQLQTRFMPFKNDSCIFIGYVYRAYSLGHTNNSVDLSEIDYNCTPGNSSVRYIWRWSYIKMDQLKDTTSQPPLTLTWTDWYACESPIFDVGFFAINDVPLVAFVQAPHTVVFTNLLAEGEALPHIAVCKASNTMQHLRIRALRVIPRQNQFLVIQTSLENEHLAQLYRMPKFGKHNQEPDETRILDIHGFIPSFQISDNYQSMDYIPGHPNYFQSLNYDPPPISIFVQTNDPPGLLHYTMMPMSDRADDVYYTVEGKSFNQQSRNNKEQYDVLPGIHRALVYKTIYDDSTQTQGIVELRRYLNKKRPHPAYISGFREVREPLLRRYAMETWRPIPVYLSITLPNEILQRIRTVGMGTITWDEGTGRVCISSRDGKVVILDMGRALPANETVEFLDQVATGMSVDSLSSRSGRCM
ncbi:uncharacterized protein EV420DRAFT_1636851 [Desarmillaria tabescens]|uniref:Uncharacterized protein n=1 Tax=Armillaria tabescens TaxID=1929756 RepID=A0AA39NII1_ARMTA|nr:uncharacterized protein EV420DRAFT_1636851 [Desarmillaria tabescens]KAK0466267.1 hypothetical protein EV420DRAFT_1636851 [Desarmillaria tabescens]